MAKMVIQSNDATQPMPVIRDESPRFVSQRETPKTNVIHVSEFVIVITKVDGIISLNIRTNIFPLPNGKIPVIDFNASDEALDFNEDGFRLNKIVSVIQKQAYTQYPECFKNDDPDVIIDTYSIETRKDDNTFPDFKNSVLDTLESVFDINV